MDGQQRYCPAWHNGGMGTDSTGNWWRFHCVLGAGHQGDHCDVGGVRWSYTQPPYVYPYVYMPACSTKAYITHSDVGRGARPESES